MPIHEVTIRKGAVRFDLPLLDHKADERVIGRIDLTHYRERPAGRLRGKGHRLLLDGLVDAGEKLSDGRVVASKNDAINWILEQIATSWAASAGADNGSSAD